MHAIAPGKVMLFGEYAVLEGHRALVVAVDRYAHAQPLTAGPWHALLPGSNAPQHNISGLDIARQLATNANNNNTWQLDTRAFGHVSQKLGIGSSAASLVALCAALYPHEDAATRFAAIEAAHRTLQQGIGSGADVAASTVGGLISYRRGEFPPHFLPLAQTGLTMLFAHTGQEASTTALVKQVKLLPEVERRHFLQDLGDIAAQAQNAILARDANTLLRYTHESREALRRLGDAAATKLVIEAHDLANRLAAKYSGAAKPTGAGGGDLLLCLVPQDAARDLQEDLEEAGFFVPALRIDTKGARIAGSALPEDTADPIL